MDLVFTRQKSRAGENPESPPRTQPGTNISEVRTPSRKLFTQEHNEFFLQQVFQYAQENEGDDLNYHVLGLNESSREYDMKKYYCNLPRRFHPDKNKHSQASELMLLIKEDKEELEDTLRYNDAMMEQERVRMAHKYIEISSDFSSSFYSDDLLETLSDGSSDSGTKKERTKPVTSSNKSSAFTAEQNSDNEETP